MKYKRKILELLKGCRKELLIVIPCMIIITISTFAQPLVIREIMDDGMIKKNMSTIIMYTIILFTLYLTAQIFSFIQTKLFVKMHNIISKQLYTLAFHKICLLPVDYYSAHSGTEVTNQVLSDVDTTSAITDTVLSFTFMSVFQIISGTLGLAVINSKLSILVLIAIPVKYICVVSSSEIKKKHTKKYLENMQNLYSRLGDIISGIKEIKIWQIEHNTAFGFSKLQDKLLGSFEKRTMSDQIQSFVEIMSSLLVQCLVYLVGGFMVVKGKLSVGSMIAFIAYVGSTLSPISTLIHIRYNLASIQPSMERLFVFLDLPEETNQRKIEKVTMRMHEERVGPVIEFKNVEFSYNQKHTVLKNVSFKIYRGEKVLLIGKNGSGKSTVLDLLLGFYTPNKGSIEINGCNIQEYDLKYLRSMFSVVVQAPYLFNDTIENNIDIKSINNSTKLHDICRECGVDVFVNKDSKGYKHMLGSSANNVSGGEKKKIAVARALFNAADIYIFDEATAGYDKTSYSKFLGSIQSSLKDSTIINVSHNSNEFYYADRIIELNDGYATQRLK